VKKIRIAAGHYKLLGFNQTYSWKGADIIAARENAELPQLDEQVFGRFVWAAKCEMEFVRSKEKPVAVYIHFVQNLFTGMI
jgi:hypothetical protein